MTPTQFKDKQFQSNGKVTYDQGPLYFDGLPTVGECTNVCKTRSEVDGAAMSLGGAVSYNIMGLLPKINIDEFIYDKNRFLNIFSQEENKFIESNKILKK